MFASVKPAPSLLWLLPRNACDYPQNSASPRGQWRRSHQLAAPAHVSRRSPAWFLLFALGSMHAQEPVSLPVPRLGAGPFVLDTAEQHKIRVAIVTRGLEHPWSLAFLPDGSMLVTERPGRLRVIRKGVLDPKPITGLPDVRTKGNGGLM